MSFTCLIFIATHQPIGTHRHCVRFVPAWGRHHVAAVPGRTRNDSLDVLHPIVCRTCFHIPVGRFRRECGGGGGMYPKGRSVISRTLAPSHSVEAERGATINLEAQWHRIVLFAIVALSAVLNFIGLSREGYDNEYYSAAVKSMSLSWHNFFFNSFDPGGFVTIDKPPLGFWFQVASVKLFGFNGVAILLPQALAGVLAVALLYHLVARTFGRSAGLIAALALAITPISVVDRAQ